jgi:2-keto-4-pentenoate hydratase/2-oxohepta-3-ene-1,7-dioic acid hydratase in catechol pathway
MGANFRKHVEEAGLKCPRTPVLFIKPPTSLAGPGDIPIPKFVHEDRDEEMGPEQLDFETELAFVVSKDARDITPEEAKDYILGSVSGREWYRGRRRELELTLLRDSSPRYTSANDITGRFHQFRQAQWNFAKGFDKFCPIGPVLVSPERVGNVCELDFKGCLNGTVMQHDNTK